MHARLVRSAAAVAVAAAGTLTWAPAASAEPSEPTSAASAARAETPAPDAGSVEITAVDTAGAALPGATFLLLDSTGQETGRGQSDAQGKATFPDLAPGIYRLKQTATGSPFHEAVADQDVIVTSGNATRLTIADPFKAAQVLLQAKDDKTGNLLPGASVNIGIGTGTSKLLTLTTGAKGTVSSELPMSSRSTMFWVKEIKAPAGYALHKPTKTFTAVPGTPVTVTFTHAKTATGPKPDPSDPRHQPTHAPVSPGAPRSGAGGATLAASGSHTPDAHRSSVAVAPVGNSTPKAATGSLAHTGADATLWQYGGAAVLIAAGAGALLMARRHRAGTPTGDSTEK